MTFTSIQASAAKWVMAKGITFTLLVCAIVAEGYVIIRLDQRTENLQQQVTKMLNQTIDLESNVIKENTQELAKFNLINNPPRSSGGSGHSSNLNLYNSNTYEQQIFKHSTRQLP